MSLVDVSAPIDIDHLRSWIGHSERAEDRVNATAVAAMAATLDRDDPHPVAGFALPPLWHWAFFTPHARQSEIGPDGHARRGGFLPPVPLPRRMWAGGRLEFLLPLHVGDDITRVSIVTDVTLKEGKSGPLVFVCVRHEIANAIGLAIVEEHDIVYRQQPPTEVPVPPLDKPPELRLAFCREVVPDPVLLFRYSALTFNGHRIHYDRDYVTEVEKYPGLVVHGPLIATLLLDALRRHQPSVTITRFRFRALRPIFDIHRFLVGGVVSSDGVVALYATDQDGYIAMEATAETAAPH